ncbi:hypothetical protein [Polymorphospora lycopeni]|uniref:Uncharacterized protein n=1 Tax=Polymorphospora lycopeni TaxID=3140240 RepID=A0ABV5CTR8_9ACTN
MKDFDPASPASARSRTPRTAVAMRAGDPTLSAAEKASLGGAAALVRAAVS